MSHSGVHVLYVTAPNDRKKGGKTSVCHDQHMDYSIWHMWQVYAQASRICTF